MMAALAEKAAVETILTLGAEDFVADCAGALWWDAAATLVVSDLHLEKGSSFATRGQFLPPYDTGVTLAALAALIARYRPRRVVALGDSFHDGAGPARMSEADQALLAGLQHAVDWLWIAGNHDPDLSAALPGDHADRLDEAGIAFIHEPSLRPAMPEIAGHLHPCAKIRGRGRTVRRRAFVHDSQRLIMPAMGTYAGGLNLRDPAIARLFPMEMSVLMLGDDRVYTVGHGQCWPD
jgi:hypothetical protein